MQPWFPFFPHFFWASAIFSLHLVGQILEGTGFPCCMLPWVPELAAMKADRAIKERQEYPMAGVLMDIFQFFNRIVFVCFHRFFSV